MVISHTGVSFAFDKVVSSLCLLVLANSGGWPLTIGFQKERTVSKCDFQVTTKYLVDTAVSEL